MMGDLRWIDTGGVSLRYELTRCGLPGACTAVLVHEMGGSLENWDDVVPALAAHCDVLRYDLRGAGLSEKLIATPTLALMTDDLLALIDAVCPFGPLVLAGAAVGAAIALQAARARAPQMRGLALLAPSFGIAAERQEALEALADRIAGEGMRAVIDTQLERSYPPVLRGDTARFATFRARQLGADPHGYAATYRMLAGMRPEALLGPVPCPTVVLAGTHDGARPPALVRQVAAGLPGATYREWAGGHFLAWQTPAAVAAELTILVNGT